ncbi:MAG TPA: Gfo/Idh/MocA family oxidoreductase [Chthonomonas sp.]|uniref:Gfo/Idh/MocA family protein n=1 Tax=Chthonomonas sp. TaxID=2282153 RepID=UPI002B4B489E|nr:Gfo/Idh/MocA family oxidoreductase [Chthonomonas sp.]HLI48144.1 Gfo/Idh/MocA family oxidoreductase [Chthonomonas sp.]
MAKKVRVGVIGTGGIANGAHLPGYANIPDECEIVALCDINPEALQRTAQRYPQVKHLFDDYRKLLELDEIDAVSVCTHNAAHYGPTVDALKAGKHVLCEKPIAINTQEAKEMVETARKQGKILQVGFNSRFSPTHQALKRFIDAGDLGDIYYARVQALRVRGIPGWGVFTDKEKQGGGPLIDIGVHVIDLALWFMGHPKPISATGMTYQKLGNRDLVGFMGQWDYKNFTVEDLAVGFVRFENGLTMTIEASFAANWKQDTQNITLLGTDGGLETSPPTIVQEKHKALYHFEPRVPGGGQQFNTYNAEIKSFVECVRDGKEPLVTGEQALIVAQITEALYRSAESGKEVAIA